MTVSEHPLDAEAVATLAAYLSTREGPREVLRVRAGWMAIDGTDDANMPHVFLEEVTGFLLEFPTDVRAVDLVVAYDNVRGRGRRVGTILRTAR